MLLKVCRLGYRLEGIPLKNLLTKQERRWFYFIEKLTENDDWMILADLSSLLDCSKRILKMDILYLNEEFDDFTIHTSNKGIKIEYNPNRSFNTFCQKLLVISDTYSLLEIVFLNENIKVNEISEKLDISLSTLYRMIDQLNTRTEENFGFIIATGPCRISGDEEKIRLFFYTYFFEKYRYLNWPFNEIDLKTINDIIHKFVLSQTDSYDFVYFNVISVVAAVNYIRYKNNHLIEIDKNDAVIGQLPLTANNNIGLSDQIEETLGLPLNEEFISQVLNPFLQPEIYHTHQDFMVALENDSHLKSVMEKFRAILSDIATKNNLQISNLETVMYVLYNAASMEYKQPQASHILFDQNGFFANQIKKQFPIFHKSLYDGMHELRAVLDRPITEAGINFYIFTVVSWWDNLVPELHHNQYNIKVLVISDRHQSHAKMIKDFIACEFGEKLSLQTTHSIYLDSEMIDLSDYDLIISSYMDKNLSKYRNIYISNIPQREDLDHIKKHVDDILASRLIPL